MVQLNRRYAFLLGRKNVGYLYAIANGAKVIFDFDDDNLIKFWMEGSSPDPVLDIDNYNEHGLSSMLTQNLSFLN